MHYKRIGHVLTETIKDQLNTVTRLFQKLCCALSESVGFFSDFICCSILWNENLLIIFLFLAGHLALFFALSEDMQRFSLPTQSSSGALKKRSVVVASGSFCRFWAFRNCFAKVFLWSVLIRDWTQSRKPFLNKKRDTGEFFDKIGQFLLRFFLLSAFSVFSLQFSTFRPVKFDFV